MPQIPKISFIGLLTGAMSLVGLPSNPRLFTLVEVGIIIISTITIYPLYSFIDGIVVQDIPSSWVNSLSLVTITMFLVSYLVFRLPGDPWKTQGYRDKIQKRKMPGRSAEGKTQKHWGSKSGYITAFATVLMVGLVMTIAAHPHLMEPDVSQEHVEPNSAEQSRNGLVIRFETTEDIWVIETERKDDGWEVGVERDTVYLAAATIIGLVSFGVAGIRKGYQQSPNQRIQTAGFRYGVYRDGSRTVFPIHPHAHCLLR